MWSPELKLQFGYGFTDFLLDWQPSQDPILSSVSYNYLVVGGEFIQPLYRTMVHLFIKGNYRPVLSLDL